MQLLLFDDTGSFDPLTMTQVQDNAGHLQRNKQGPLSKSYDRGSEGRPGPAARVLPRHDDRSADALRRIPDAPCPSWTTWSRWTSNTTAIPIRRRCAGRASTGRRLTVPTTAGAGRRAGAVACRGELHVQRWSPASSSRRLPALGTPGGGLVRMTAADLDRWSLVSGCGQSQPVRRGSLQGAEDSSEPPRAERQPGLSQLDRNRRRCPVSQTRHIAWRLQTGARSGDSLRRNPP